MHNTGLGIRLQSFCKVSAANLQRNAELCESMLSKKYWQRIILLLPTFLNHISFFLESLSCKENVTMQSSLEWNVGHF